MFRLLALDLDGTTLTASHQIPDRTKAAIQTVRERGVTPVIVTGRMQRSAAPYAEELGLKGLPMVTYNGAFVSLFPSTEPLYHEPLPLEAARKLAAFCEREGIYLHGYQDDQLCIPAQTPEAIAYQGLAGVEGRVVGALSTWLGAPQTKMIAISTAEQIAELKGIVQELLGDAANVTISNPTYLEVMSSKVSKGKALAAVAERLGVKQSEVLAIGDGLNDLEMLRWAGTGVAMGHAHEQLKAQADWVTTEGPGDGVWEAIRHFGLVEA
ncbi:MAG TPA: Cof-type HAD-IIB family hydrolase [Symbiobacteriaceae bacterium]|nr:Cof-type HAD-IIB family hydrolase [Symbiobacteriaceae bacterium]